MIYLQLFLTFLKIGCVSFGGGYGMISLINEECIKHNWLTSEQFLDFVAVGESTPGPISVNIATFVGSSQAGVLGAFMATLGVVVPSFVIMLIIVSILKRLIKCSGVQAFLGGVRPAVVGLIIATAILMFLEVVLGLNSLGQLRLNTNGLIIFLMLLDICLPYKIFKNKTPSPIYIILLSGALGVILG